MIVVEQRLEEVFSQLPAIGGFKPVYKWGNESHLIKQIKMFSSEKKTPYPLIYQTSNRSNQNDIGNQCTTSLRFFIACQNTQTELLNENRWAMSYGNVLYPTMQNISKAFQRAGIFNWGGKYVMTEFPNYGGESEQESKTIDILDALLIETDITIMGEGFCVNDINFN